LREDRFSDIPDCYAVSPVVLAFVACSCGNSRDIWPQATASGNRDRLNVVSDVSASAWHNLQIVEKLGLQLLVAD